MTDPDRKKTIPIKIINARLGDLTIDQFTANPGEAWCLVGSNRSGIDSFFRLLAGEAEKSRADLLELPPCLGIVSFSRQQLLFEAELKKEETDFMDRIDPGTPARSFLKNPQAHDDLIRAFDMSDSLDKGFRQLSTGQSRKLMILAQITQGVLWLVIQTPYEGLDPPSCHELDKSLALLHRQGKGLMIFVHNRCDIPEWCTHVGVIAQGHLGPTGARIPMVKALEGVMDLESPDFQPSVQEWIQDRETAAPSETNSGQALETDSELVVLNHGSAGYNGTPLFTGLNLRIHTRDHTLVTGPNGSGKSTLLQVITGDHPACYQNDLRIFGIQRGTGESIWELKKEMGIVSSDLHRNYHVPGTTLHCILSGLFDSIGLYQRYTSQEEQLAKKWLGRLGMTQEAQTPFRRLSYANQRLVLIARSLIKVPRLLILDEPTQGLDESNRRAVLDFLEQVAQEGLSTLLYVSHRQDEFRPFFKFHLRL